MKRLDLEFFNEVLPKAVPGLQVVTLRQGYSVDRAQTRLSLDCIIDDMAVALLGEKIEQGDDRLIELLRLKVQSQYPTQRALLMDFAVWLNKMGAFDLGSKKLKYDINNLVNSFLAEISGK